VLPWKEKNNWLIIFQWFFQLFCLKINLFTPTDLYGKFQIKAWTIPFWILRVERVNKSLDCVHVRLLKRCFQFKMKYGCHVWCNNIECIIPKKELKKNIKRPNNESQLYVRSPVQKNKYYVQWEKYRKYTELDIKCYIWTGEKWLDSWCRSSQRLKITPAASLVSVHH